MNLKLTDEELKFRDELRTFFATEIPAEIRERASGGELTKDDFVTTQKILNANGLAVPHWPAEWGGKNWTPVQRHIYLDEMQLASVPDPLAFNADMVGPVIAAFGSQEQKEKFLHGTANLDIWWCQGFSEPEAGSDLASLKTKAVRDGDSWIVNGQKTWTTLGQHADWIFCLVRTDPDAPKRQQGISFLLIDMKTPGITVRPIKLIDGGYEVNEVWFEDVRVPAENLVGEENAGWSYAKFLLGNERTGVTRTGASKAKLAKAKKYAAETKVGDGSLLDDPLFAARFAELENELVALELTQLRRRQAEPGVVAAQAARLRTAAGGNRDPHGCRRPRLAGVRRRRRHRIPGVGSAQRTRLPELPQGVHLQRLERGSAQHHILLDSRIVSSSHGFRTQ
jgi:alkylation response protein AidB-like acyl-CoA dehydrogenase